MATLPGRCNNDMYCSLAASGEVVSVPAEGRYVCPACGKPLVSPTAPRPRRRRRPGEGITPAGILLVIGGFVGGMLMGGLFIWPSGSERVVISTAVLNGGSGIKAEELLQPLPMSFTLAAGRPRAPHRGHAGRRQAGDSVSPD